MISANRVEVDVSVQPEGGAEHEKNRRRAACMNEKIREKCKSVLEKAKKEPYSFGFRWLTVLLFVIPVLIWGAYLIGDNVGVVINTSLTVGDALGFYASVLAFIGTIALGAVAVWQNQRLQKLEENASIKNFSCNILLENFTDEIKKWSKLTHEGEEEYIESEAYIRIKATNFSDAFLKKVLIQFEDGVFVSHVTIANGECKYLKIHLPRGRCQVESTKCRIIFISCHDIETYGDFSTDFTRDKLKAEIKHYHFYGNQKVTP